ncbi:bifunctional 2-polyprenyl-6-hydroxyphenol methylase/3-demethylubiquinol 3-O-methyltransferase UbiG [Flavobacterium sp. NKUCC04_CG]|uniref:class I SAM-dependent methyltransferase n=1 Tax=Flavobacterium sp. NKUCC04_CG TaxID=2842121 RepID=UPI001C5B085D|nr:class I SAM-dependent methyltransferase [Flavobacterium sp. NKUCC04_CG]MBW3519862.1 class I SAM-dependent methyltransferase [Flavobacterium sp. NKUCC04_CG]
MEAADNYIEINKHSWNNRTATHLNSEFYNLAGFLKGETSLNSIELDLLKDIKGKRILHLQCHFGQDTISLSRLGAEVTGVDLSDKAIEIARKIAKETNSEAQFICCDLYDLEKHLDTQFDMVFTSYGTITWLPDLDKWGKLISRFLKPGGKFIFVEFHPVVWMFDDNFEKIDYNYFNVAPIIETENGTYADKNADISQSYVTWNHSMSEVITALVNNSIALNEIQEFDYSPYNIFSCMMESEPKKYRIKHLDNKIPLVYSIVGTKK